MIPNLEKDEFNHPPILEQTSWIQKSRVMWLKDGDRNMKILYVDAHLRGNFISRFKVNGGWLSKDAKLKPGILLIFQSMFEIPSIGGLISREESSRALTAWIDKDWRILLGRRKWQMLYHSWGRWTVGPRWIFYDFLEVLLAYSEKRGDGVFWGIPYEWFLWTHNLNVTSGCYS